MVAWFRTHLLVWFSLLWYVGSVVCDHLSSLHVPVGYVETNPYARDLQGGFIWRHALVYDGIWLMLLVVAGTAVYRGVRRLDETVGQLAFAVWFLALGFSSWAAVVRNVWIHLGWYVPVL